MICIYTHIHNIYIHTEMLYTHIIFIVKIVVNSFLMWSTIDWYQVRKVQIDRADKVVTASTFVDVKQVQCRNWRSKNSGSRCQLYRRKDSTFLTCRSLVIDKNLHFLRGDPPQKEISNRLVCMRLMSHNWRSHVKWTSCRRQLLRLTSYFSRGLNSTKEQV